MRSGRLQHQAARVQRSGAALGLGAVQRGVGALQPGIDGVERRVSHRDAGAVAQREPEFGQRISDPAPAADSTETTSPTSDPTKGDA